MTSTTQQTISSKTTLTTTTTTTHSKFCCRNRMNNMQSMSNVTLARALLAFCLAATVATLQLSLLAEAASGRMNMQELRHPNQCK